MSTSKSTDDNKNKDESLPESATTKAKEVAGSIADKAADTMESAAKKIKEVRKED